MKILVIYNTSVQENVKISLYECKSATIFKSTIFADFMFKENARKRYKDFQCYVYTYSNQFLAGRWSSKVNE